MNKGKSRSRRARNDLMRSMARHSKKRENYNRLQYDKPQSGDTIQ